MVAFVDVPALTQFICTVASVTDVRAHVCRHGMSEAQWKKSRPMHSTMLVAATWLVDVSLHFRLRLGQYKRTLRRAAVWPSTVACREVRGWG